LDFSKKMQDEQPEEFSKKAKSHKGRKILTAREAKLEEGPRKTLFLKSTKTSDSISKLSHDLVKKAFFSDLKMNYIIVFIKKTQFISRE